MDREFGKLDWSDLQILLTVARAGSLSQAAALLNSSHPTLFRRIRAIERTLGAAMFERSRQGYRPTSAATEFLALAEEMAQRIAEIEMKLAGKNVQPATPVTISATETLMHHALPAALQTLRRDLPTVAVHVVISDDLVNLQRREADIALRVGGEPPDDLIGRIVCKIEVALYQPADWAPVSQAELGARPWVTVDDTLAHQASFKWLQRQGYARLAVARANRTIAVARLAEAGLGLAALPCHIGDSSPHLRRVTGPFPEFQSPLWLLSHRQMRGVARIGAVLDVISDSIRAQAPLFEGRCPRPGQ